MTQAMMWEALKRIERHADVLSETDHNLLRPSFAALHGAQAIRIPEKVCALIRHLDATLPKD
jgi:hypothetical protein